MAPLPMLGLHRYMKDITSFQSWLGFQHSGRSYLQAEQVWFPLFCNWQKVMLINIIRILSNGDKQYK